MAHFKCLACTTRLYSTDSDADPIGDRCPVCGSLLEPIGELDEIVGYRVIETLGSAWHRGASRAGKLIAGRVGEDHRSTRAQARTSPARNRKPRRSLSHPTSPSWSLSRSRSGDEAVSRRAPRTAALPRVPRAIHGVGVGRYRRGPRSQRRVRISPWSACHGPALARLSGAG